ncbi:hypothetical protein [Pelagicoccus sp. SDUM812005]|uniref:hypothetical protein n=1 Tax=Pelagicoccus sp. SDUM812005 TaxID=3041257 RepID=UPI00280D9F2F|nr:hypothetical protein [Pelagicoccus sp. SDUM812005]MDQ8180758.1 hypothetical protein [Pelagicoccus sp. SDUM812005]
MRQLGEATAAAKMNGEKLRPSEFEIAIPGTEAAARASLSGPRFEDLGAEHPLSILAQFDANQDGKINFRENMQMAFAFSNPVDIGNGGSVGESGIRFRSSEDLEELEEYLGSVFDGVFSKEDSEALFARLDKDKDGVISEVEMEEALEEIESQTQLRIESQLERERVASSAQAEVLSNDSELRTAGSEISFGPELGMWAPFVECIR